MCSIFSTAYRPHLPLDIYVLVISLESNFRRNSESHVHTYLATELGDSIPVGFWESPGGFGFDGKINKTENRTGRLKSFRSFT